MAFTRARVLTLFFLALSTFFFFSPPTIRAADNQDVSTLPRALIINQVRGEECCNPGSLDFLELQIKAVQQLSIPATFALRYDALSNPSYVNLIKTHQVTHPQQVRPGLLIEVTPTLAAAANVPYRGTAETWFAAQNIFTIGYSPTDRIKLIDQLMQSFHDRFGYYPELTSAWMIDTPTLNYLHDRYQVKLHQITREQWGIDSYTLDGGPIHYPYPASRNWAFMPDYQQPNPLIIARQTVTDPLYIYGDTTSAFTSQPNDYHLDGKNFSYFQSLIDQALNQPSTPGFVLIGLENSMPLQFQQEFVQQLEYLESLSQAGRLEFSNPDREVVLAPKLLVSSYTGSDLVHGRPETATWITTPKYRLRLRQANHSMYIDDLRVFDNQLSDPYAIYQAQNQGYWITPYLLNGSRWHIQRSQTKLNLSHLIPGEWLRSFEISHHLHPLQPLNQPHTDLQSLPQQLQLPAADNSAQTLGRISAAEIEFTYNTGSEPAEFIPASNRPEKSELVNIRFLEKNIEINGLAASDIRYFSPDAVNLPVSYLSHPHGFELKWPIAEGASHSVELSCQSEQCVLSPILDPANFAKLRQTEYPAYLPEVKARLVDDKSIRVGVHNRYALAGRNPIRLLVTANDEQGFPTLFSHEPIVTTDPPTTIAIQPVTHPQLSLYYIDVASSIAQPTTVNVSINSIHKNFTVYFAPNCKAQLTHCLTHPFALWQYVMATIGQKFIR